VQIYVLHCSREERYLLHTQKFHNAHLKKTAKKKSRNTEPLWDFSEPCIEKQTVYISFKLKMPWITSKHGVLSKRPHRL
jgi:hypothetical protein